MGAASVAGEAVVEGTVSAADEAVAEGVDTLLIVPSVRMSSRVCISSERDPRLLK